MRKRITYEFVKEQFEKEGYKLLSKNYVNSQQKLLYICPNSHEHNISWNNWQQGERCFYCYGTIKKDIEFIRFEFKKEGYELLSKSYINNNTKLKYRCPLGHEHFIGWDKWISGRRCPYCSKSVMPTFNFINSSFKKESYILLSNECNCAQSKLEYICPEGHKHSISWNNWQRGQRCPFCTKIRKKINTFNIIKAEFEKENYVLLTNNYSNVCQKLSYICPNGHKHSISWSKWQENRRCPECANNISKGETQVRNFIESLGIKVSANDRGQIFNPDTGNGLELDIFMPTLDKAIEYNGEYWHQDKTRDLLKQQLCKSKGIELLTIWDKKWLSEGEKCRNEVIKFVFRSEEGN